MPAVLMVGIAFSVLLSIFLLAIDVDQPSSVIIGLVVLAISLVLELMLRIGRMERRLIEVNKLSLEMAKDAELFAVVAAVVRDYREIADDGNYRLFAARAKQILHESSASLHNLVEGYMVLPPLSEFSFGLKGIAEVKASIKATSYVDAENFWKSVAGERYFQKNVELVARGVRITRVFIGDRSTVSGFRDIIARQRDAGIAVLIALADELPRELCEDYLVADDKVVAQLHLTREGLARTERVSIDQQEVHSALTSFERLVGGAYEFEEIFPDEPGN